MLHEIKECNFESFFLIFEAAEYDVAIYFRFKDSKLFLHSPLTQLQ